MNRYRISSMIRSALWLPKTIVIDDIALQTVDGNHASRIVIALGEIEADSFHEATTRFDEKLLPALDAVTVQQVTGISAFTSSILVERFESDYALLRIIKPQETPATGLFEESHIEEVRQTQARLREGGPIADAARYFRDSLLTISVTSIAFSLLRAAEALAGTKTKSAACRNCNSPLLCKECDTAHTYEGTDHGALKTVLGKELHTVFYVSNQGALRHTLMHGRPLDPKDVQPHITGLHETIRLALRERLALKHQMDWGADPRSLERVFITPVLLKSKNAMPPLMELLKRVDADEIDFHSDPTLVDAEEGNRVLDSY